jgi:hypothetical protein
MLIVISLSGLLHPFAAELKLTLNQLAAWAEMTANIGSMMVKALFSDLDETNVD